MAFERKAELLALLVLSACALYGYLLSVPLFLYLLGTRYWLISVLYLSFLLVDRNVAKNGGRPVAFLKFSSLWRHYANYFPVKLVKTCDLDPSKNYIFGYHPHGILGIAAVINFAMNGTDFRKLFPGITTYTATLKLNFWLPVFRDFLLGIGMVSCSKKSIENICGRHRHGNALTLAIGGAAESYDAHPGSCTLTLKNRKGFIRMALTTGAQLVPVYSFGETDIFRQVGNPPGSLWRSFQEHFHSATGVVPCLFYGRGVLDNSFGLLPLRQQVITVVGTPIPVEQCLEPDDKLVDYYHQKYVDQLTALFEQYKHLSQHPDGKLVIK